MGWEGDGEYSVIVEADSKTVTETPGLEWEPGELIIKGPNVFKQYYNKPEATQKEFTRDGWFKTGDTSQLVDGVFKILGRTSVDIIKSGGYKISALDVERVLLTHPDIQDVSVVGLDDPVWGQVVAAVIVTTDPDLTLARLREWGKDQMSSYSLPTRLIIVDKLPRNVMGKVNKKELAKEMFTESAAS